MGLADLESSWQGFAPSGGATEDLCPWPYQCLEAICIPWLMTLSFHLQSQQHQAKYVSCGGLSRSFFCVLLLSLGPLVIVLVLPGQLLYHKVSFPSPCNNMYSQSLGVRMLASLEDSDAAYYI